MRALKRAAALQVWPHVAVLVELAIAFALLVWRIADTPPPLQELQRVTATIDDVTSRCKTDIVGGGPATVTFCSVAVTFEGHPGSVRPAYDSLSLTEANGLASALGSLEGRTVDAWLLGPTSLLHSHPEIWQLEHQGNAVISYSDVVRYKRHTGVRTELAFASFAGLLCAVDAVGGLRAWRRAQSSPSQLARLEGSLISRVTRALLAVGLLVAIGFASSGDSTAAGLTLLVCGMASLVAILDRSLD